MNQILSMRAQAVIIIAFSTTLLGGCRQKFAAPISDAATQQQQLDAGYSLLLGLMEDESRVKDVLVIKSAPDDTKTLLKDISTTCSEAAEQLQAFGEADPDLAMDQPGLPLLEQATRDAIASATAGRILLAGKTFEVRILLTQAEALNYGNFLARSIAKGDTDPDRSKYLDGLASRLEQLWKRTTARFDELVQQPADSG